MASNPEDVIADIVQQMRTRAMVAGQASLEERDDALREAQEHEAYFLTTACDALEAEVARLTAAQATPPASPEAPDRTREAFRAGFLAVCKRKGDTQLLDILARVWSFDGVAAADLEPEAYEAWRSVSPVPVAPQEAQAEVLASLEAIVDDMEARWDMDDPSTNPGIRDNVKRAHAAIRAVRRSVSPAAEER